MGLDGKNAIESGRTALGIEFGSTRIKAVLIDETMGCLPLATMTGKTSW